MISQVSFADADDLSFIELQKTNSEDLANQSPKELEKKPGHWQNLLSGAAKKADQTKSFVTTEFAPSAAAFYFGSFLQILRKMATEPEKDAEMLKNFLTNQIFSASAQASFMMFLVGAKTSNAALYQIAQKYSWLKDEKKILEVMQGLLHKKNQFADMESFFKGKSVSPKQLEAWKQIRTEAERLTPGKLTLAGFGRIQMFSGFGVGFLVSTIFSDIVNDPDIMYYADWLVSSPEKYAAMVLKKGYTPQQAFQRAYERWVIRNKILDYTPHLLSAFSTIAIQAFVLRKVGQFAASKMGAVASKIPRMAVKSIQFVSKGIKVIPQTKLLSVALHAYTFLEINEMILPYLDKAYHGYKTGNKIAALRESLDKKIYRPNVPSSCYSQLKSRAAFNEEVYNKTSYSSIKTYFDNSNQISCEKLDPSYPETLDEFHYQMNVWREFWFKKSFESVSSWSSYLEGINGEYFNTFKIYENFITEVNSEKTTINLNLPFYGLTADPNQTAKVIVEVYRIVSNSVRQLSTKSARSLLEDKILRVYNKLLNHLKVFDTSLDLPDELQSQISTLRYYKLSPQDEQKLKMQSKERYASKGIEQFNKEILADKDLFSDVANNIASFGTIKTLLGKADPVFPGKFFIDEKNLEVSTADKEKEYNVYARTVKGVTNLSLLNMACGPRYTSNGKALDFNIISRVPILGVIFTPPRIAETESFNVCLIKDQVNELPTNFAYNGKIYASIVDFISSNLNAQFKGKNGVENFKNFWSQTVDNEINAFMKEEEGKIHELLSKTVFPAIASDAYSMKIPAGLFEIYKYELGYYFTLIDPLYKKFPDKMVMARKYLDLFLYAYTRPNNVSSWLVKIQELDLKDAKELFDATKDLNTKPFISQTIFLRVIKEKIIQSLVLNTDMELSVFSSDQIDAILALIDKINSTADSVVGSLTYLKFFELVNPVRRN